MVRPAGGPGSQQSSPPSEAAKSAPAELPAREPANCGFGAVRVGALLGRLRLHLQTERFLAVHRSDAVWEAGCLQAALALAEIVAALREEEMSAALTSLEREKRRDHHALFAPDNTTAAGQRGPQQPSGLFDTGVERSVR